MNERDQAHREAMRELQAKQRAKTRELRDPERGLLLVHTGNGKGKSSSAFGVIARALGWGRRVAVVQFIKGKWITGERRFFERFPEELTWHTMGDGFTWDTQDRQQDIVAAEAAMGVANEMMAGGDYDLVVLDEINIALRYDYLSAQAVLDAVSRRSARTSVILTGRDAPQPLIDAADLVSEMVEVKHPFRDGIKAQQGIDF